MKLVYGDVNVYWVHEKLTPQNVRAAAYGHPRSSGTLLPDVGDIIRDFPGLDGDPIIVQVKQVKKLNRDVSYTAYEVRVVDVDV